MKSVCVPEADEVTVRAGEILQPVRDACPAGQHLRAVLAFEAVGVFLVDKDEHPVSLGTAMSSGQDSNGKPAYCSAIAAWACIDDAK